MDDFIMTSIDNMCARHLFVMCDDADVLAGSAVGRCVGWITLRPGVCRQRFSRQDEGFLHAT